MIDDGKIRYNLSRIMWSLVSWLY